MEQPPFQGKTWGLTPYEMNRGPQEAVTDNTEIAVSPRSLHNELMCPICLDMLKNTMTTKECLHRFCQDCIITALRSGNKECPTCRKKLVSKRSLRPDPNFDALISKIYPSRDEYEAHQERVLERLKQSMNQEAFNQNIEEGLRQQALSRNPRRRINENDPSEPRKAPNASDESNSAFDAEGASNTPATSEVELVFRPHPTQFTSEGPPTRYIKTTSNASIEHLSKYLAMRIALEKLNIKTQAGMLTSSPTDKYNIYIQVSNNNVEDYILLPLNLSLTQTCEKYWHSARPIELFYALDHPINP